MTSLSLFTFMHWRRKWQPTPVFLPAESQGRGSLVVCCLWGCTESDTTEQLPFHSSLSCLGEGNGHPLLHHLVLFNAAPNVFLTAVSQPLSFCAAAAKSLQSGPTLCDLRDSRPPGSPVPGILQARTLEWIAISFSNA